MMQLSFLARTSATSRGMTNYILVTLMLVAAFVHTHAFIHQQPLEQYKLNVIQLQQQRQHASHRAAIVVNGASMTSIETTSTIDVGGSPYLKSILKKPSKVLTVGVEYSSSKSSAPLSASDISILSMQLRKTKVSAIWCSNVEELKEFAKEQETAKGNFPGPCPVIFHGEINNIEAAVSASATAIILDSQLLQSNDDLSAAINAVRSSDGSTEIIWKVSSSDDVQAVLDATENAADAFWLQSDEETLVQSIPKGALWIGSVNPMLPDGEEISNGKALKTSGCGSIFVPDACIGDEEDLDYAKFLVDGMTSKASSEFKFSGLTGSTNGHFGGVQASGTTKWRRTEQQ